MVGLPDGKTIEDMFSGVYRIPACDGQTSCDGIVRAMHTRRAVKIHRAYSVACLIWNFRVKEPFRPVFRKRPLCGNKI